MWRKRTQIRMQTKPVRSKWTLHKSHSCFCILLTIKRKFKFWTGNSIWFRVRKVPRQFLGKKRRINSCSVLSYLSLPYMYTFWNPLLNNYCYWLHVDYLMTASAIKKNLGGNGLLFLNGILSFWKYLCLGQFQALPNDYLQMCRESIVHLSMKIMWKW